MVVLNAASQNERHTLGVEELDAGQNRRASGSADRTLYNDHD